MTNNKLIKQSPNKNKCSKLVIKSLNSINILKCLVMVVFVFVGCAKNGSIHHQNISSQQKWMKKFDKKSIKTQQKIRSKNEQHLKPTKKRHHVRKKRNFI